MTREAKLVRVDLKVLECRNTAGDDDATIELYGFLYVKGVYLDGSAQPQDGFSERVWYKDEAEPVTVGVNTDVPVNATSELTVFDRDFLWLGGRLMDHDDLSADDLIGDGFRQIHYQDITDETVFVGFSRDNLEIVAKFVVKVLRVEPHPDA